MNQKNWRKRACRKSSEKQVTKASIINPMTNKYKLSYKEMENKFLDEC